MRVDVIVTTYNRAAMLAEALESLLRQDPGRGCVLELLVVDNASTDSTRAVVEAIAARSEIPVRYVCERARGVAHARARGVRESTAEWIAFFDDDQIADGRWLGELVAAARESGARCVGGGVALALEDGASARLPAFCRGLLGETPGGEPGGPYRRRRLPGTGNVLVHRSVFEAVGPFDAALDQGEDAEFFRRVRRAGFSMWYAPGARIVHRAPASRTTGEHLAWLARRHGAAYATIDAKEAGRGRLVRNALLRAGQALVLTVPALLRARARRDGARLLEVQCRLARAVGYERQALRILAPRAFEQARFFEELGFGKGGLA
jgi:GT2 family glycosyltransferase